MFLTIVTFIIVFSLLIFAHELGHFWTVKKLGVKAEEFGFGFPPRIFGVQILRGKRLKKIAETEKIEIGISESQDIIKETIIDEKKEIDQLVFFKKIKFIRGSREPEVRSGEENLRAGTIYSLNWIPLGGFVKIKGEDGTKENESDSFANKKIWKRAVILSAGVSMNIILAAVLISLGLMIGFPQFLDDLDPRAQISEEKIQIAQVLPDSPAFEAGLKVGDIIMTINGKSFVNKEELQSLIHEQIGEGLAYQIKRDQEEKTFQITPEIRRETGRGGIGIAIATTGIVKYPWYLAIKEGVKTTLSLTWAIIRAFYNLIKGLIIGEGLSVGVAGPVGIAVLTGQAAQMGFIYILQFTAILSINLAIINFLPLPALDGGRILFLIIEKIKGSPVKREVEGVIHNIGFSLLMLLVLIVTFKDVTKFSSSFMTLWERIIGN